MVVTRMDEEKKAKVQEYLEKYADGRDCKACPIHKECSEYVNSSCGELLNYYSREEEK